MTYREELHILIDQLPDEEIQRFLEAMRQNLDKSPSESMRDWLEKVEPFQARLREKYGELRR